MINTIPILFRIYIDSEVLQAEERLGGGQGEGCRRRLAGFSTSVR